MRLYDLPSHANPRPRIYGLNPNGDSDGWVEFDHPDGMYSYCVAFAGDGSELGVCHLSMITPLVEVDGGYRVLYQ